MACMNNLNVLYILRGILCLSFLVIIYFIYGASDALMVSLLIILMAWESLARHIKEVKNESKAKNLHG